MKKYTIKNFKGNMIESLKKFQNNHPKCKINEAVVNGNELALLVKDIEDKTNSSCDSDENCTNNRFNKVFAFGYKLLNFGVKAHIWHLNARKNSIHMTLQDLYETCDDVGDKLIEAVIGLTGTDIDIDNLDCVYECDTNSTSLKDCNISIVDNIRQIKCEAEAISSLKIDVGISNVLDDFCASLNSIIYKLSRLT